MKTWEKVSCLMAANIQCAKTVKCKTPKQIPNEPQWIPRTSSLSVAWIGLLSTCAYKHTCLVLVMCRFCLVEIL